MSIQNRVQELPFEISIIVTHKNDLPCIELRRVTTNIDIIKTIISCAFHGQTIIVKPVFKDSMKSLNSLIEKGLIYRENNQYFFTQ